MKLALISSDTKASSELKIILEGSYNFVDVKNADCIVVIGGDGFMLKTLHYFANSDKKFYGINSGTVGFLMNRYHLKENLIDLVQKAKLTKLNTLKMEALSNNGFKTTTNAINEIYLTRKTNQISKIKITINGISRMENLSADGVILSTAAGSTAYNLSAGGAIIPLGIPLLALTPICPFRPRNWKGALLPDDVQVKFDVIDSQFRLVNAFADGFMVEDIRQVIVFQDKNFYYKLLFDENHNLEDRIINEQFNNYNIF
jgi:NAD+ kinase